MDPTDLKKLERALGHRFERRELLEQALSHSSYARELQAENPSVPVDENLPSADYEQMEFLGDAVLGLVTSQELFERFPHFREGRLSKLRAYLVSEKHLIGPARKLEIGRYLRLGRGEDKSGGREKTTLQVDALEAILAALYIDAGLEKARTFILKKIIDPELKRLKKQVAQGLPITDYKSALQEALHSAAGAPPAYVLVREEGPQHRKTFNIEVRIRVPASPKSHRQPVEPGPAVPAVSGMIDFTGRGEGSTKKKAEQAAAQEALEYLWARQTPAESTARLAAAKRAAAAAGRLAPETGASEKENAVQEKNTVVRKRSRAAKKDALAQTLHS